jgi:D-alanyl-D-alanine carboxypeptidase (penicillin-binding protein 5/6)
LTAKQLSYSACVLFVALWAAGAVAAAPVITAKAAIVVDRETGVVLWQHNPDRALPPASTTKVVTAMLALESGRLDEPFRVSSQAARQQPSKIHLKPGWRMTLRDLVYAILLNSANDASVVIAEGLSGSVAKFAGRMNVYARSLGTTRTHFVNPNGLPARRHYSTVRDLARIFDHALDLPGFRQVIATKRHTVRPTRGSTRSISLRSKNKLLDDRPVRVVGKTGWTRKAKKCFVGAGSDGKRELVVAVLGSRDLWGDVDRLLEFGYAGGEVPVTKALHVRAKSGASATAAGDAEEVRAGGGRYYVRLATFRSPGRARRLKTAVVRRGYNAKVYKVRSRGRAYYRVSVGAYANHRRASKAAREIVKRHPDLKPLIVAKG